MNQRAPYLNARLQGFGTTIFDEMSVLAATTGAINLGQGFPDTDGPEEIAEAAVAAIREGHNQYPPGRGVPELRLAVAEHQRRRYGLEVDPATEVLVTTGATEALAASLLALCDVGDEVVVFDPSYDVYAAAAAMAGAGVRVVTLHPPRWTFDPAELDAAITARTKVVVLNTPHNPTGKVFSPEELAEVAHRCVERDLVAVTDEVYEHLVFEGRHVPLATLPGMAERTVTISSAAKTFSFTGWKVGWACGPAPIIDAVRTAKQYLTYASGAPFQYAVAEGLAAGDKYIEGTVENLRARRDQLCAGLAGLGLDVNWPPATYFVTTDIAPVSDLGAVEFCRTLPRRCGVVAVPVSVFYQHPGEGTTLVRWAFCKRREVLDEALARLAGRRATPA
ncbi:MAG TPA: pyridoxal phosphate-dependent aminotransferase [Acidimicrobiales bacterium]|nr:pyridoxal phosphate-dependent aminotransferase [Acidimicrobiales bacterium]